MGGWHFYGSLQGSVDDWVSACARPVRFVPAKGNDWNVDHGAWSPSVAGFPIQPETHAAADSGQNKFINTDTLIRDQKKAVDILSDLAKLIPAWPTHRPSRISRTKHRCFTGGSRRVWWFSLNARRQYAGSRGN